MAVTSAETAAKRLLDSWPVRAVPRTAEPTEQDISASGTAPTEEPAVQAEQVEESASVQAKSYKSGSTFCISPIILTHHKPRSQQSEQIRQLRTTLLQMGGQRRVCCMITSARPREGKTVTAANLAYSFSEIKQKKTLLIDADLRHGRVAELFGLSNEVGLSQLLTRRCVARDVFKTVGRPNLYVITAGEADFNETGEILSAGQTDEMIRQLLSRFDHVVVDGPPVIGLADAALVGRWVNMALLAVRMRKTPKASVEQAVQILQNAGVNVSGIIAMDGETARHRG
ncbi:MAG: CpsD/CapB family tyrosine-protein kinase [Planctomycetes bacterium]|nr:CpsD/CapB family tyrosine-protein kinase [Planctomycetota bacterium]